MNKQEKIDQFDPNGVGAANERLFGLPFNYEEAEVVIIPVPWEVTVSHLSGTAMGPQAVLDYSPQIDLYDFDFPDAWKMGIYMLPISEEWLESNQQLRKKAQVYIKALENGESMEAHKETLKEINSACYVLKNWIKEEALGIIKDGKIPAVLGGDHSSPLGLMEALAETHADFGILQIDAHADLRVDYEGFTYSHASIMYNALKLPEVLRLLSVGVRDICEAEVQMAKESFRRILPIYDHELSTALLSGKGNWQQICRLIGYLLPQKVYISLDIDGLQPANCPNTGTPVPGGLSFEQAIMLLQELKYQEKTIVGFDLCEISVGEYPPESSAQEYNANVGSRLLYKLANLAGWSNGRMDFES